MITFIVQFITGIVLNIHGRSTGFWLMAALCLALIIASQLIVIKARVLFKEVSYKKGLVLSLLVPGLGQAALGYPYWGFFLNLSVILVGNFAPILAMFIIAPVISFLSDISLFAGRSMPGYFIMGSYVILSFLPLGAFIFACLFVFNIFDYRARFNNLASGVLSKIFVALFSAIVPGLGNAYSGGKPFCRR